MQATLLPVTTDASSTRKTLYYVTLMIYVGTGQHKRKPIYNVKTLQRTHALTTNQRNEGNAKQFGNNGGKRSCGIARQVLWSDDRSDFTLLSDSVPKMSVA